MKKALTLVTALTTGSMIFALSFVPACAFSIITPAAAGGPDSRGAVTAFAVEASEEQGGADTLLSPGEVAHIRWCAERYRSYHATDNSYATSSGARVDCRSPL
ncbi:BA14K family protein [Rhizobium sp. 18055]|jgi:hypothetical protein|uniref:BA14K family protein n=1 Tax=Rhizobium sp. 18055 TaxID=2681403 RepID=UPI0013570EA1|nr:BA14K family protein [Rhizobium sp. 18055]